VDSFYVTGNAVIASQGFTDTTDWNITNFNGAAINRSIPRSMNFQYMVEVDPANAVAVRKNYNMGRYDHEGGWIANDEKTVYLTDDKSSGSVLFKFVANAARDFSAGQLYAYKQSTDGQSGSWLTIPMQLDSVMDARNVALHMGASVFMRLEWVDGKDNMVYITETGRGKNFNISGAMAKGGVPAKHFADFEAAGDGVAPDVFGRVLRLNTTTNKLEVMLEGGGTVDADNVPTGNHLTSPDGLTLAEVNGKTVLMIQEDLNLGGAPASPDQFASRLCEIYLLDITGDVAGKSYEVSDLVRFAAGPKGCEVTGGRFTPDGSTFFFNVQHPDANNAYPFNHSVTIAVSGFEDYVSSISDVKTASSDFAVWPNPVAQQLNLSQVTDVRLFEVGSGKLVRVARNTNRVDVSDLPAGMYIMQTINGDVKKVIVQ
jgi:secreted PhoX family phosphatase